MVAIAKADPKTTAYCARISKVEANGGQRRAGFRVRHCFGEGQKGCILNKRVDTDGGYESKIRFLLETGVGCTECGRYLAAVIDRRGSERRLSDP